MICSILSPKSLDILRKKGGEILGIPFNINFIQGITVYSSP